MACEGKMTKKPEWEEMERERERGRETERERGNRETGRKTA